MTNGEMIKYASRAGEVAAYISKPEKTSKPAPGVILIHEIFGLSDHIKDVADRLARAGYVTIAPDLFSIPEIAGVLTSENLSEAMKFMHTLPMEKMRDTDYVAQALEKYETGNKQGLLAAMQMAFMGGMPKPKLVEEMKGAAAYLRSLDGVNADKIGSMGFCFGGGMSILLACNEKIDACIIFYGENPDPISLVENVKGPIMGIYGGKDIRISSNVDKLLSAAVQYNKAFEMKLYPEAAHAFFNDTNERTYNKAAAEDAWERVLSFFSKNLSSGQ
ncbi:MAG: dienelactone hydrolase family protein [Candidatus Micrarchaeales archaeon]|jgi:carboxymethylenebutenolidase|nr:dienelactone hydrolase family protein [Candidatus Micrarchaeales archaeon]